MFQLELLIGKEVCFEKYKYSPKAALKYATWPLDMADARIRETIFLNCRGNLVIAKKNK